MEERGSMEISVTFDLLAARESRWKWEDYSLSRLRARLVNWLEVTSALVYLESPMLGRDARFGCVLVFISILTYHIVGSFYYESKIVMYTEMAVNGYSLFCVGLFVYFHKMHRPLLSDTMLVFAMFTDMLWDAQVFTTMVLCQSHPLPVTVGAIVICVKDELRGWCHPNVVLCPGLWMDRLFMYSFYTLAVVVHCIDYTSRVRFVESGAPCEVDVPWDGGNYQESRFRRVFVGAWKLLRWSAHPVFLKCPIAGRPCRRASALLAIFPLWNIWLFFRCKLHYWFPERGSLPTDLAVAAFTVLVPALATAALQRRGLLNAAIASDVVLAFFVLGAWGLLLCQCLPVPDILLDKPRNFEYVVFRIIRAQDMTVVGLALTGIHPAVCVQVYIGCCALEIFRGSLPMVSWLEATIAGLFCFCQTCSFFWRLAVIKSGMAKTQANAAASSMIQDYSKSWNSSSRKSKSRVDMEQDLQLEMSTRDPSLDDALEDGLLGRERSSHQVTIAGSSPHGNDCTLLKKARARGPRPRSGPMIAVLRHGERADSGFESSWPGSDDSMRHPFDPPITDRGFAEARETAMKLKDMGEFHLVVSSPYLRCVQTGLDIAKCLDCALVLDAEAGEVFGPKVFGDVPNFEHDPKRPQEKPWRTRRSLQTSLKSQESGPDNKVFWGRVLGTPPEWPESLQNARLRYTKCLLSYMRRAWETKKNIVLVTHQPMVQACLRVLPASSFLEVDRVPYCSGMVAWLHRSAPACLFTARHQEESNRPSHGKGLTRRSSFSEGVTLCSASNRCVTREEESEESLHDAGVQWWEVALLGIDAVREDLKKRNKDQVLQSRCYQELGPCWQHVKKLLGGLPDQPMREVPLGHGKEDKRDSGSTVRSLKSPHSPHSFRGSSFTSSAKSEAWTITSSTASTAVVTSLSSNNWQPIVARTGDKIKSPMSPTRMGSGRLSVELDSSFAISPALQQLRQDGNCRPLSRVGDVKPSQGSSGEGQPQFTLTSSLARRRASQR